MALNQSDQATKHHFRWMTATAGLWILVLVCITAQVAWCDDNEWNRFRTSIQNSGIVTEGADPRTKPDQVESGTDDARRLESHAQYTPILIGAISASTILCLGVGLGYWMGRRTVHGNVPLNAEYLLEMLGGMGRFTDSLAGEFEEVRTMCDQLQQRVSGKRASSREDMQAIVDQLSSANQRLHQRLEAAEESLKSHQQEVESYLSEARKDPLTDLPNRRTFDDHLQRSLAEWARCGTPVSLVMLDVDRFKSFNDRYGHVAGDKVLCDVAKALAQAARTADILARYGGEEFAVILPGAEFKQAAQAAERLRKIVDTSQFNYEGQQLAVTISCGAAQVMLGDTAESLTKRADESLYAAKNAGRNRAFINTGELSISVTEFLGSPAVKVPSNPNAHAPPGNAADLRDHAELSNLCNDLRRRLHEVLETRVSDTRVSDSQ